MSDFKDLKVWQKAHELLLDVHRVVDGLRGPKSASLKGQMYRAAESIPANIVESRGWPSNKEAVRFLRIALNSSTELEYHLLIARDLRMIDAVKYERLTGQVIEVRKMLYGLIRHLQSGSRFDSSPKRGSTLP